MTKSWVGQASASVVVATLALLGVSVGAAELCGSAPSGARPFQSERIAPAPIGPRPSLRLVWYDVNRAAPPTVYCGMTEEVGRFLRQMDVDATWVRGEPGRTQAAAGQIHVLLLNELPARGRLDPRALGAVERNASPPGRIWLYFPNVVWALGLDPLGSGHWASWQDRELSMALGRVVAHELVHLALPSEPHAHQGLMAARTDRGELLRVHPRLSQALRDAFVSRLSYAAIDRAAFSASLSDRIDSGSAAPGR